MADDIVWEDPPPLKRPERGPGVWMRRLTPLREHPGKWANLGIHKRDVVAAINSGHIGGGQKGEFEAKSRDFDAATGQATIYVRYVGPDS